MIVKEIISQKILTMGEAKEILEVLGKKGGESVSEREGEEKEIRYERRKALEHTTKFAKMSAKKSRILVEGLLRLNKINEEVAVRIADMMPQSKNEVRAIYAKEKFTLTEADIEKILDCVAKYE
jgi:DNA-directed RNA polymerase subunit F